MKHLLSLLLFTVAISLLGFAQDTVQQSLRFEYSSNFQPNKNLRNFNPEIFIQKPNGTYILDYINIKGSPYENNEFTFGKVTDESSNKSINLYLRYNIYNDIFELKANLDDNKTAPLLKANDLSCKIGNNIYYYLSFTDENNKEFNGYLKLLYKGKKYSLYQRLTSHFTPRKEAINSFTPPVPPTFDKKISYYIKQGEAISFLPYKKKHLLKKYPSQSKAIKTYLSRTRPNLRKKNDLISFVRFLDTIK
jgi:hypothetical protein